MLRTIVYAVAGLIIGGAGAHIVTLLTYVYISDVVLYTVSVAGGLLGAALFVYMARAVNRWEDERTHGYFYLALCIVGTQLLLGMLAGYLFVFMYPDIAAMTDKQSLLIRACMILVGVVGIWLGVETLARRKFLVLTTHTPQKVAAVVTVMEVAIDVVLGVVSDGFAGWVGTLTVLGVLAALGYYLVCYTATYYFVRSAQKRMTI